MTFSSRSLFLRRRESMLRVAIDFRLRENGDVGVRSNNGDFKKFPPPSSGRVWVAGLWARCLVAFFLGSPPPQSSPSRGEAFLLAADADSIYAWPTRMRAAYVRTRPKRKSGLGRGCGVSKWTVRGSNAKSRWDHISSISSAQMPNSSLNLMTGNTLSKPMPMRAAPIGCRCAATQLSGFGTTTFSKTSRASWRRYPAIFGTVDRATQAPSLALPLEGGRD